MAEPAVAEKKPVSPKPSQTAEEWVLYFYRTWPIFCQKEEHGPHQLGSPRARGMCQGCLTELVQVILDAVGKKQPAAQESHQGQQKGGNKP